MNIRAILFVALLSVSAAASAKKHELPLPLAQDLQVEVVLNQQELGVDVPATAANVGANFGLLGALIGGAITAAQVSSAEKRVAEIRNVLVDYRFNENIERELRAKLASEGLSPNPQFTFMATPWDAYSAAKAGKVAANGVLIITPRYSITNNFELMKVSLSVMSVDRSFKSNGKMKQKVVFMRAYSFQFPLDKVDGSFATEDSQRWVNMGKEDLQGLLDQGVTQVVDMLVYDFSPVGREAAKTKVKAQNTFLQGKPYWGWNLRKDPNWIWMREYGGFGINGYQPVGGKPTTAVAASTPATTPSSAADAAALPVTAPGPAPAATAVPQAGPTTAVPAPTVGAGSQK